MTRTEGSGLRAQGLRFERSGFRVSPQRSSPVDLRAFMWFHWRERSQTNSRNVCYPDNVGLRLRDVLG